MIEERAAQAADQRFRWRYAGLIVNWAVQLALVAIGAYSSFDASLRGLWLWCIVGSVYAITQIIVLAIDAQSVDRRPRPEQTQRFRWYVRAITILFTLTPALIGVGSALQIVVLRNDAEMGGEVKFLGVWSILLAWGFLHWGFAQVYFVANNSVGAGNLFDFPSTRRPVLLDFVYFAYTVGTTFAASDVTVLSTRTRWLVTVHSVLGFFLNSLIIVLAFETIISFEGFSGL